MCRHLVVGGGGGGGGCFFFFFKKKTAYEMCGRDWSSDVCSSDLMLPVYALINHQIEWGGLKRNNILMCNWLVQL